MYAFIPQVQRVNRTNFEFLLIFYWFHCFILPITLHSRRGNIGIKSVDAVPTGSRPQLRKCRFLVVIPSVRKLAVLPDRINALHFVYFRTSFYREFNGDGEIAIINYFRSSINFFNITIAYIAKLSGIHCFNMENQLNVSSVRTLREN